MLDVLGIDIGAYKTVLAKMNLTGVDIVLSEAAGKATPTTLAFTDGERLVGDSASTQMRRNFKNSLQYFTRFVGLTTDTL